MSEGGRKRKAASVKSSSSSSSSSEKKQAVSAGEKKMDKKPKSKAKVKSKEAAAEKKQEKADGYWVVISVEPLHCTIVPVVNGEDEGIYLSTDAKGVPDPTKSVSHYVGVEDESLLQKAATAPKPITGDKNRFVVWYSRRQLSTTVPRNDVGAAVGHVMGFDMNSRGVLDMMGFNNLSNGLGYCLRGPVVITGIAVKGLVQYDHAGMSHVDALRIQEVYNDTHDNGRPRHKLMSTKDMMNRYSDLRKQKTTKKNKTTKTQTREEKKESKQEIKDDDNHPDGYWVVMHAQKAACSILRVKRTGGTYSSCDLINKNLFNKNLHYWVGGSGAPVMMPATNRADIDRFRVWCSGDGSSHLPTNEPAEAVISEMEFVVDANHYPDGLRGNVVITGGTVPGGITHYDAGMSHADAVHIRDMYNKVCHFETAEESHTIRTEFQSRLCRPLVKAAGEDGKRQTDHNDDGDNEESDERLMERKLKMSTEVMDLYEDVMEKQIRLAKMYEEENTSLKAIIAECEDCSSKFDEVAASTDDESSLSTTVATASPATQKKIAKKAIKKKKKRSSV